MGASYEKAGLAAESSKKYELGKIPVDNRYETFPLFGNQKDLDDYNNYKKTGKFDIDLADPKLISGVLNEHKSRAQQLEARRASSSELQEAQDNIADIDGTHGSSARIKAQQKQDKRDYEAIYGEELYKITTVDGRTYVPPTVILPTTQDGSRGAKGTLIMSSLNLQSLTMKSLPTLKKNLHMKPVLENTILHQKI